ncbi:MAG: mobilization protein [Flavobacteriaceae bacterium]|nr:mobilization protein [Flavobacteriaceae bacterium]
MYIGITAQQTGFNYKGSVRDLVNYLEKENEGKDPEMAVHFFNQYRDKIPSWEVIAEIDGNTAKLKKDEPKFYSLVVSPSQAELKHISNNQEYLQKYVRELMKDYAASFYRDEKVTVDAIKYYAKIEYERYFTEADKQIKENQPYATKILELKNEIYRLEKDGAKESIRKLENQIDKLERQAPHQQQGKRIVQGMQKEGYQGHVHIIVSRMDMSNTRSLSPGAKNKVCETSLNGKTVKQGFDRDKFYKAAEKTFDKSFGFKRNYVESYQARNLLTKDPKQFFSVLAGLPANEKQAAFKLLHKAGVEIPRIPVNQAQLALKAFMKLKKGIQRAMESGSIGI